MRETSGNRNRLKGNEEKEPKGKRSTKRNEFSRKRQEKMKMKQREETRDRTGWVAC
jgi:hypothetical protein